MASQRTRVAEGGRLVIPAELRRELGLEPGTEVVLSAEGGALLVRSLASAIAAAQALVARHVPPGVSLAEELIAERRAEAARE